MKPAVLLLALAPAIAAQKPAEPQPRVVTPGVRCGQPPDDAVVLFDGKDLSHWTTREGQPAHCAVDNGEILCKTGAGDLVSKETFRNAQIHLEFRPPFMPDQHGQARGNSGVYLQGRYEIQILDSYQNPTYANGSCGALYGQAAPLVNASRAPEQWQTYDIVFHGPQCDGGNLVKHGIVTVLHNGVLVQDHVEIQNTLRGCAADQIGEPGPLLLQDHNYKGAPTTLMRFRNIWFRPLPD
jgi:hypothetical protein